MNKYAKICFISIGIAAVYTFLVGSATRKYQNVPALYLLVAGVHALQILASIPAIILRTQKFFDLTGTLTFINALLFCVSISESLNLKQYIAAGMIFIWSARLGGFLFYRILKAGEDSRFKTIKMQTPRFFMSWILQALWVTLTAGPIFIFLTSVETKNQSASQIGSIQVLGLVLWLLGFLTQSLADLQKLRYNEDQRNRGKFISSGLWKYSRHPNYCGEVILWVGASIFVARSLEGLENMSLISPVFVYLLLSKVSGVPMLEAKAQRKWGGTIEYETYKKRTPIMFGFEPGVEKKKE